MVLYEDGKVYIAPGMYLINKETGLPLTIEEYEKRTEMKKNEI